MIHNNIYKIGDFGLSKLIEFENMKIGSKGFRILYKQKKKIYIYKTKKKIFIYRHSIIYITRNDKLSI